MARTPAQIIGHDALLQLIFEGYAVVPAQPTEAMIQAALDSDGVQLEDTEDGMDETIVYPGRIYRAMLNAAEKD